MVFGRINSRGVPFSAWFGLMASVCALSACPVAAAQAIEGGASILAANPAAARCEFCSSSGDFGVASAGEMPLFAVGSPASAGGGKEHFNVAPDVEVRPKPFSRMAVAADISPLGVGIKGAVLLSRFFDARLTESFFNYNSRRFEVEGVNVTANLHLASTAAALDWYPFNGGIRLSTGLILYNSNQISAKLAFAPGAEFDLGALEFYSDAANSTTGAVPMNGTGTLGLHSRQPAFTLTTGFGKYIPRSRRHWSYPFEIGVAFTGAPTVNAAISGWTCTDKTLTHCGNISDPASAIGVEFSNAFQTKLTSWRKSMSVVEIYPILSYGVSYSFDIR